MPSCDAAQLIGKVCSQRRERRPVSVATNWSTEAGLGADWHVANRARCPHHAALENSGTTKLQPIHRIREGSFAAPRPRFIQRGTHELLDVITHSTSDSWSRCGAWVGSIPASDVRLGPLGVVKASARTALPEQQRFEAKALDDMQATPWRPSTKHRGAMLRAHETEDEDQSDEEQEEALDVIQMDIYSEDDPRRDSLTMLQGRKMSYSEGSASRTFPKSKHELCQSTAHILADQDASTPLPTSEVVTQFRKQQNTALES